MFEQRDAKRQVQVSVPKTRLKIGVDTLEWTVHSERAGYV